MSASHDKLVRALARTYENEGYVVQADGISHPNGSPQQIGGYVPDITASTLGAARIAEAETDSSLNSEHTRNQWRAFSRIPGTSFEVIVPQGSLGVAKSQAAKWGINVNKWWYL